MIEFFNKISLFIDGLLMSMGILGPLLGCLLIVVESIIPILPISVFITINFLKFGNIIGFIISWVFTVVGCCLSFWMFDKGFKNIFERRLRNKKVVNDLMKIIDNIKFENLVMLIVLPFAPAFAINIAAGLSDMEFKKYFKALLLGKIFFVYFWGFVGTGLIESLKNPTSIIKVIVIIIVSYIISKIVSKKVKE